MQAFTDVPVNCCDCEKTFLSASSLLQHFAEHVKIQLAKDKYEKFKLISRRSYRKYFLNNNNEDDTSFVKNQTNGNTQLVNVSGKRDLRCSSPILANSNDNSRHSLNSEKSVSSSVESSSSEQQIGSKDDQTDDDIDENSDNIIGCKSPLLETQKKTSDVDFDDKLMLNSDFKLFDKTNKRQFCVEFNSEKMLIDIERLPSVSNSSLNIKNNNDKNIEDNEVMNSEYDKGDENSLKRKLSNRKQLVPKKIERVSSSYIKIAPKPKDLPPVPYESTRKSKPKKKYSCNLCTKSFGWSTDLKRHILVHTGERPFKCTKCDASFTRNFLLQKHKNKIHPSNKDLLEKDKLLEEKVNENLKQLKSKMNKLSKFNSSVDGKYIGNNNDENSENVQNGKNNKESEVGEQITDEEMTFAESKVDIKEEIVDPLSFNDSDSQQDYINGNSSLANNNNNNNNNNAISENMIKSEDIRDVILVNTDNTSV